MIDAANRPRLNADRSPSSVAGRRLDAALRPGANRSLTFSGVIGIAINITHERLTV